MDIFKEFQKNSIGKLPLKRITLSSDYSWTNERDMSFHFWVKGVRGAWMELSVYKENQHITFTQVSSLKHSDKSIEEDLVQVKNRIKDFILNHEKYKMRNELNPFQFTTVKQYS